MGGPDTPDKAYLVNERGTEILMGASGTVLSNSQSRRMLEVRAVAPTTIPSTRAGPIRSGPGSAPGRDHQCPQFRCWDVGSNVIGELEAESAAVLRATDVAATR